MYGYDEVRCECDSVAVCGVVDGDGLYGLTAPIRRVVEQAAYVEQQSMEERSRGGRLGEEAGRLNEQQRGSGSRTVSSVGARV